MTQEPISYLAASDAVEVAEAEFKSPIANTTENLKALSEALAKKFGRNLKVNVTVIKRAGLLPDGSKRVPLAVMTKSKPGGSLTCWVDKNDPEQLNCVWSGVIASDLLDEAGIERW